MRLPPAIIDQVRAWVRAGYPSESCGLLFASGTDDIAVRAVLVENMADRLHAMDPVEYPRTSREYFAMNEAKVARQVREAEAAGERWLAIWHSHIDCGAYFSDEDKLTAAPGGQCVYPQLYQLVVDARADGCREAQAFRWNGHDFANISSYPEFAG
ncbi:MAG: Mov34/MPN/PAD-1 family protein [Planctomycetota bacterium]